MKFQLWTIGKNHGPYVKEAVDLFTKRISNYYPVEWNIHPSPKNAATLSEADLKKKEGDMITGLLQKDDWLVLLDENGKQLSSEELAKFIQIRANESIKNIVFLIGGAG